MDKKIDKNLWELTKEVDYIISSVINRNPLIKDTIKTIPTIDDYKSYLIFLYDQKNYKNLIDNVFDIIDKFKPVYQSLINKFFNEIYEKNLFILPLVTTLKNCINDYEKIIAWSKQYNDSQTEIEYIYYNKIDINEYISILEKYDIVLIFNNTDILNLDLIFTQNYINDTILNHIKTQINNQLFVYTSLYYVYILSLLPTSQISALYIGLAFIQLLLNFVDGGSGLPISIPVTIEEIYNLYTLYLYNNILPVFINFKKYIINQEYINTIDKIANIFDEIGLDKSDPSVIAFFENVTNTLKKYNNILGDIDDFIRLINSGYYNYIYGIYELSSFILQFLPSFIGGIGEDPSEYKDISTQINDLIKSIRDKYDIILENVTNLNELKTALEFYTIKYDNFIDGKYNFMPELDNLIINLFLNSPDLFKNAVINIDNTICYTKDATDGNNLLLNYSLYEPEKMQKYINYVKKDLIITSVLFLDVIGNISNFGSTIVGLPLIEFYNFQNLSILLDAIINRKDALYKLLDQFNKIFPDLKQVFTKENVDKYFLSIFYAFNYIFFNKNREEFTDAVKLILNLTTDKTNFIDETNYFIKVLIINSINGLLLLINQNTSTFDDAVDVLNKIQSKIKNSNNNDLINNIDRYQYTTILPDFLRDTSVSDFYKLILKIVDLPDNTQPLESKNSINFSFYTSLLQYLTTTDIDYDINQNTTLSYNKFINPKYLAKSVYLKIYGNYLITSPINPSEQIPYFQDLPLLNHLPFNITYPNYDNLSTADKNTLKAFEQIIEDIFINNFTYNNSSIVLSQYKGNTLTYKYMLTLLILFTINTITIDKEKTTTVFDLVDQLKALINQLNNYINLPLLDEIKVDPVIQKIYDNIVDGLNITKVNTNDTVDLYNFIVSLFNKLQKDYLKIDKLTYITGYDYGFTSNIFDIVGIFTTKTYISKNGYNGINITSITSSIISLSENTIVTYNLDDIINAYKNYEYKKLYKELLILDPTLNINSQTYDDLINEIKNTIIVNILKNIKFLHNTYVLSENGDISYDPIYDNIDDFTSDTILTNIKKYLFEIMISNNEIYSNVFLDSRDISIFPPDINQGAAIWLSRLDFNLKKYNFTEEVPNPGYVLNNAIYYGIEQDLVYKQKYVLNINDNILGIFDTGGFYFPLTDYLNAYQYYLAYYYLYKFNITIDDYAEFQYSIPQPFPKISNGIIDDIFSIINKILGNTTTTTTETKPNFMILYNKILNELPNITSRYEYLTYIENNLTISNYDIYISVIDKVLENTLIYNNSNTLPLIVKDNTLTTVNLNAVLLNDVKLFGETKNIILILNKGVPSAYDYTYYKEDDTQITDYIIFYYLKPISESDIASMNILYKYYLLNYLLDLKSTYSLFNYIDYNITLTNTLDNLVSLHIKKIDELQRYYDIYKIYLKLYQDILKVNQLKIIVDAYTIRILEKVGKITDLINDDDVFNYYPTFNMYKDKYPDFETTFLATFNPVPLKNVDNSLSTLITSLYDGAIKSSYNIIKQVVIPLDIVDLIQKARKAYDIVLRYLYSYIRQAFIINDVIQFSDKITGADQDNILIKKIKTNDDLYNSLLFIIDINEDFQNNWGKNKNTIKDIELDIFNSYYYSTEIPFLITENTINKVSDGPNTGDALLFNIYNMENELIYRKTVSFTSGTGELIRLTLNTVLGINILTTSTEVGFDIGKYKIAVRAISGISIDDLEDDIFNDDKIVKEDTLSKVLNLISKSEAVVEFTTNYTVYNTLFKQSLYKRIYALRYGKKLEDIILKDELIEYNNKFKNKNLKIYNKFVIDYDELDNIIEIFKNTENYDFKEAVKQNEVIKYVIEWDLTNNPYTYNNIYQLANAWTRYDAFIYSKKKTLGNIINKFPQFLWEYFDKDIIIKGNKFYIKNCESTIKTILENEIYEILRPTKCSFTINKYNKYGLEYKNSNNNLIFENINYDMQYIIYAYIGIGTGITLSNVNKEIYLFRIQSDDIKNIYYEFDDVSYLTKFLLNILGISATQTILNGDVVIMKYVTRLVYYTIYLNLIGIDTKIRMDFQNIYVLDEVCGFKTSKKQNYHVINMIENSEIFEQKMNEEFTFWATCNKYFYHNMQKYLLNMLNEYLSESFYIKENKHKYEYEKKGHITNGVYNHYLLLLSQMFETEKYYDTFEIDTKKITYFGYITLMLLYANKIRNIVKNNYSHVIKTNCLFYRVNNRFGIDILVQNNIINPLTELLIVGDQYVKFTKNLKFPLTFNYNIDIFNYGVITVQPSHYNTKPRSKIEYETISQFIGYMKLKYDEFEVTKNIIKDESGNVKNIIYLAFVNDI